MSLTYSFEIVETKNFFSSLEFMGQSEAITSQQRAGDVIIHPSSVGFL